MASLTLFILWYCILWDETFSILNRQNSGTKYLQNYSVTQKKVKPKQNWKSTKSDNLTFWTDAILSNFNKKIKLTKFIKAIWRSIYLTLYNMKEIWLNIFFLQQLLSDRQVYFALCSTYSRNWYQSIRSSPNLARNLRKFRLTIPLLLLLKPLTAGFLILQVW